MQKVVQQLYEVGNEPDQFTCEGSGSTQDQQDPNASHPVAVSSCCSYVCYCSGYSYPSLPVCALSVACGSIMDAYSAATACTGGPGKLSSFTDDPAGTTNAHEGRHLDSQRKNKQKMSMEIKFLPEIIVSNILSRLPFESILECKCICKAWKTLIQDPLFLATYTACQSFDSDGDGDVDGSALGFCIMGHQADIGYGSAMVHYGEYRRTEEGGACFQVTKPIKSPHKWFDEDIVARWNLIGSSNGLICFSACRTRYGKYTYTIYVYNPMTKEYVNLGPETFEAPSPDKGDYSQDVGYHAMGFGYHPSTKEYKVIRINYKSRNSFGQVKVYTLGGSRWREKEEIPYVFISQYKYNRGVLVNGALHWLTIDNKIVCFDLADEEFRNVPVPPSIVLDMHDLPGFSRTRLCGLGVLGGRLCLYVDYCVWVLKEYMMDESWTKIFSRKHFDGPLKEEDVFLRSFCSAFVSNFQSEGRMVFSYDSESGSTSIVSNDIEWFNNYSRLDIVSYTKSFVSLKALGERDVRYSGSCFAEGSWRRHTIHLMMS